MNDIDKIHIKLELYKNNSGLGIIAHFNNDAPNFFKEESGYSWMPTENERTLLYDAFNLIKNNNNIETKFIKFSTNKSNKNNLNNKIEEQKNLTTLNDTNVNSNDIEFNSINKNSYKKLTNENSITILESDEKKIDETLEKYKNKDNYVSDDIKQKKDRKDTQ